MSKIIPLAVAGAVLTVSGGMMGASQAFAKDVTLVVDGIPTHVRVMDATVAQVLISQRISLSNRDVVSPAVTEKVADGSQITVNFARPIEITLDGKKQERWTTATNVDNALAQLALRADNGRLSVSRSMAIGRDGLAFSLDTARKVTLSSKDGDKQLELIGTVGDALAAAGVAIDADDKVDPGTSEQLVDGMTIKVVTVEVKRTSKAVEIPFTSSSKESSELAKGKTQVEIAGKAGQVMEIWEERLENGVTVSSVKVAEESRTEPVSEVKLIGTKVTATPAAGTTTTTDAAVAAPVVAVSGSHSDWMAAAGIAASDWPYVEKLIAKESGWNPNAMNAYSGACGLVQALPCSKLGANWSNPVVALQWANSYVARWGGWAGAWNHSVSYGWY
ncbi:MAG: ubiquitin-like domain-containing protein [Propionibacteriaceae bacterium]